MPNDTILTPSAPILTLGEPDPILTPGETTDHLWRRWRLRRSARRLAQLRSLGTGPPFLRDGLRALYRLSDNDAWAAQVLGEPLTSTSEETVRRYPNNFAKKTARTPT